MRKTKFLEVQAMDELHLGLKVHGVLNVAKGALVTACAQSAPRGRTRGPSRRVSFHILKHFEDYEDNTHPRAIGSCTTPQALSLACPESGYSTYKVGLTDTTDDMEL